MSKKGTEPITIVLADECPLFQDGFRQLLKSDATHQIELLDVAISGSELVNKVKTYRPDVVVTTNQLQEMDAITACKIIKMKFPQTLILSITGNDEEYMVYKLLSAGADGFIAKHRCKVDLIDAIKIIASGSHYYCTSISGRILDLIPKREKENKGKVEIKFSSQEIKVIHFICKQYTTKEIASSMGLRSRTVEEYRKRVQEKMGVKNVAGLVLFAVHNNLLFKENHLSQKTDGF